VLASSFGHLHQPHFSSQRAVLSQLKCAQRACEIFWDFNIRKWPLNLSQKIAEKNMSILVWFKWCSSAAWACLKPFDWFWGKKKLLKILHFLKAISSRQLFCLWSIQFWYETYGVNQIIPKNVW
jgi:hypothetical protein